MSASAPTLRLYLRDSRALRAYLGGLHALALTGLLCLPGTFAARLGLAALLVVASIWVGRHRRAPLRRLEVHGDGRCSTLDARSHACDGVLAEGSVPLPGVVVVAVRVQSGHRRFFALPRDALAADDWRRLRVRLRVAA